MLHGCSVGEGSLIGMCSTVLNGASIGKGCIVGANALVPERMKVPDGCVVMGSPARIVKVMGMEKREGLKLSAAGYVRNKDRFRAGLAKV